ncbi:FxLYD domain-containing protein [Pseudalkalibacillus caeni]|uniref:Lipoprotein n=1 Tax=Exobacillus caeni TaxID=2574798 RepID=A0A5R9F0C4_9BACL|nr:FxLYD domain-containing protein [Pseudalkalibacillus caeni]TLS36461.1 hypothetical protein FCL54_14655 [Pseudalkalibacillus caeni]
MNKFARALGVSVLAASILSACGAENSTMSSSNQSNNENESQEVKNDTSAKEEDTNEQKEAEANIEVTSETFGSWEDSIGSIYASYSAEVTNTGDKPAEIGDIQVNLEGDDGSIIGTIPMVMATPDIIMPGETAYLGETTLLEGASSADEIKTANSNIDFSSTDEEPMMLETDKVKLKEGDVEYGTPYIVTGTVINPNEEKADDIRIAAGLYDENGKFLGALNGSIQVSLNPDGKAGFELSYPELPKDIAGKATEVKVKAYNWSF